MTIELSPADIKAAFAECESPICDDLQFVVLEKRLDAAGRGGG